MKNPFITLGDKIASHPIRTIGIASLILFLMLPGVSLVKLATGIETLIKPETSVYRDNIKLESSFGGESLVIMYETDNLKQALSVANFQKLNNIETALIYTPGVYSVITPATLIKQMTKKQSEQIQSGVGTVASGLGEMSAKLTKMSQEISQQMSTMGSMPGELKGKNPAEVLADMALGQRQIAGALSQMQTGLITMSKGYETIATQLNNLGQNLLNISGKLDQSPTPSLANLKTLLGDMNNQFQQLMLQNPSLAADPQMLQVSKQLQALQAQLQSPELVTVDLNQIKSVLSNSGSGLIEISGKMGTLNSNLVDISHKMAGLETGAAKTAEALVKIGVPLEQLYNKQSELPSKLAQLEDGLSTLSNKLQTISDNLNSAVQRATNLDPGIPKTQANLDELIYENNKQRDIFRNIIVDEHHFMAMVRLEGNLNDKTKEAIITRVDQLVRDYPLEGASVTVTGKSVLDASLRAEMKKSMQKMVVLAVGIMVLVLAFAFRIRWRILALPIIFAAVVATIGVMGFSRVPMTMVSMAVFPILIGLGVDYAIQFHNRYQEEVERRQCHEA